MKIMPSWRAVSYFLPIFVVSATTGADTATPIDSPDIAFIEAELELDQAILARDLASARLEKIQNLKTKGLSSETEVRKAEANYRISSSNLDNAQRIFEFIDSREPSQVETAKKTDFTAVPGLSLRIGAIGFGFLRVPDLEIPGQKKASVNPATISLKSPANFLQRIYERESVRLAKLEKINSSSYERLKVSAAISEIEMQARAAHYRSLLLSRVEENTIRVAPEGSGAPFVNSILHNDLWIATGDEAELASTLAYSKLLADSTAEEDIARVVIELNEIRLNRKIELNRTGYASPLEVEKARLNLLGSQAALQEVLEEKALHTVNCELLSELTDRELSLPTIPEVPRNMKEAIEQWKEIFAESNLAENREVSDAAHMALLTQHGNLGTINQFHEKCELLGWKLETLEQINASEAEVATARLNWMKADAVLRFWQQKSKETTCRMLQLAAIAETEDRLASIGKKRDQEALPYSAALAKNLTKYHETKAASESHLKRAVALQSFHDWHHEIVAGFHADNPEHPELARSFLQKEKASLIHAIAEEDIALSGKKAATSLAMHEAVEAKGSPLSILDLSLAVRDSLDDYNKFQAGQNAEVQLAKIYETKSNERYRELLSLKEKGLASTEEVENSALASSWATTSRELAAARTVQQGQQLQQIAGFFNDSGTRQLSSVESE